MSKNIYLKCKLNCDLEGRPSLRVCSVIISGNKVVQFTGT